MTPTPRLTSSEQITAPRDDREMLLYLDQQFSGEMFVCQRCGHEEPTDGCDSHIALRNHLAAAPPAAALAHPSRGVVDEAMVDRVAAAMTEFGWASGGEPDEFREDVRTALEVAQAAALPAVPEGWQPIETAPKDNACPLLLARYNPDTNELQELDFDGIWQSESESWELPKVYWYWASASGIEEPTHWMYQPAAPAQECDQ